MEKSIAVISQALKEIVTTKAKQFADETGFVKRNRKVGGADFVQSLLFGWWQEPEISLRGLTQVMSRCDVSISPAGLTQRFGKESAELMRRLLTEVSQKRLTLEAEPDLPVLRQFSAVIVEDSSVISLPEALIDTWKGYGKGRAGLKCYVRWDVLTGTLEGPVLTDAKNNDRHSPFAVASLPARCLYLADLGFFSQDRLKEMQEHPDSEPRYAITRMQSTTGVYAENGARLDLRTILPKEVGQARELKVLVGKHAQVPMRLILVRVPKEVGEERRERLLTIAKEHHRQASADCLALADWSLLLTNVPATMLGVEEILICYRQRWQIELLFKLWKSAGLVDEWRTTKKKPFRILTEIYAKLCAMVIQQWFVQAGCWNDPHRSFFQAADLLRREANRVMMALREGRLEPTVASLLRQLRMAGGRLSHRKTHPGSDQLLASRTLDWPLSVLT